MDMGHRWQVYTFPQELKTEIFYKWDRVSQLCLMTFIQLCHGSVLTWAITWKLGSTTQQKFGRACTHAPENKTKQNKIKTSRPLMKKKVHTREKIGKKDITNPCFQLGTDIYHCCHLDEIKDKKILIFKACWNDHVVLMAVTLDPPIFIVAQLWCLLMVELCLEF